MKQFNSLNFVKLLIPKHQVNTRAGYTSKIWPVFIYMPTTTLCLGHPLYIKILGMTDIIIFFKGRFIDVVARWPGSTHDLHIFRTSQRRERLDATHRGMQSGVLIDDSGYAFKPYLVTPYHHSTSEAKERYNEAHKKTRAQIEQAFGWLKRRFHVLHVEIRMAPERVCTIIGRVITIHDCLSNIEELI